MKNLFTLLSVVFAIGSSFGQKYDLTVSPTVTNLSCYGWGNGSISLTTFGGTPPYSYFWSNGDTTSSLTNLYSGTYTFVVLDANFISATADVVVSEPLPLTVSAAITDVTVYGASDGTIDITVNGLAGNFTNNWTSVDGAGYDNGVFDQSNLTAGTYTFTVTNENGCSTSGDFIVLQPSSIVFVEVQGQTFTGGEVSNSLSNQTAIFPNPGHGVVNIRTGLDTRACEIYTANGNRIDNVNLTPHSAEIQSIMLEPGTYRVIFYMEDGSKDAHTMLVQ
jgi:hypothetical protein